MNTRPDRGVCAPVCEPMEPRLLLNGGGVSELWGFIGIDYDEPDHGGQERSVSLEVYGEGLTRLEVTPPWGGPNDHFDSLDIFEGPWDGSGFEIEEDDFWFEGGTDDGQLWLELGTSDLNAGRWSSANNGGDFQVTVHYTGGQWTGTFDFGSVTIPDQEPVLTSPFHGQAGVPLESDLQWEPFQYNSLEDDLVHVGIDEVGGDNEYESGLLSPDTTGWTPPDAFAPGTQYEVDLAFANMQTTVINGVDTTIIAYAASDHLFTTDIAGVREVWVDRGYDEGRPAAGDEEYSYCVEVGGTMLTGLEVAAPWGAFEDSANWLPPGWAGEEFYSENGNVSFEAYTDDGLLWLAFEWDDLTAGQWASLETTGAFVQADYAGGTWNGQVNFDGVPVPNQTPLPIGPGPVDGQTDVSLSPTFTWAPWAAPQTPDAGVWWELENALTEDEVYEEDHAPAGTSSWTAPPLLVDTQYEFSVDFHNVRTGQVNGADVNVASWNESDILFTTGDTPAYTTTLTPGGKTGTWRFRDADGDNVTVKFAGKAGTALITRAVPDGANGDILDIALAGTDAKSALTIAVAGNRPTTVGDIHVDGPLKSLMARSTALGGDLTAGGPVIKLTLGDVADDHTITIGAPPAGDTKTTATIIMGDVDETTLNRSL